MLFDGVVASIIDPLQALYVGRGMIQCNLPAIVLAFWGFRIFCRA